MTTENENVQTAQEVIDDEAAFSAGFANVRGEEPPADAPAGAQPTDVDPETAPEGDQAAEAPPATVDAAVEEARVLVAGLTEEQLQALLAKLPKVDELEQSTNNSVRQIHGKFGELQRTINELKSGSGGQPIRLTPESLGRMNKEFPEMAQMLADDLSEVLRAPGNAPGFDAASMEPIVQERVAAGVQQVSQQMEGKLLSMVHRDWPTIVSGNDFKVWAQTLDPQTQVALDNSWDAMWLGDKISEFKQWQQRTRAKQESNKQRLEAAILPQGVNVATPALTDDAAFEAGFKAVRGK